mgnify:CR=1 FL=1|jgi:putative transferase (TIGR04331 family)
MAETLVLSLRNKDLQKENKILLAGEWVFEKHNDELKNSSYQIFNSKSNLKKFREASTFETDKIYQKLCIDLFKELNRLHSVNLDARSWKIIFGSWLRIFVAVCYERNFLINEILDSHNISKIYGVKSENFKFYSNGTAEQRDQTGSHDWNNNLFHEIIDFNNYSVEKNFSSNNSTNNNNLIENLNNIVPRRKKILNFIEKIFEYFKYFRKKSDAIITRTGFSFFYEKIFEILFFQVPQVYKLKSIEYKFYDDESRYKINLQYGKEKNIENFIRKNLYKFLPVCIIESFTDIYEKCEKDYPSNPKFIMTADAWEYDVNFKFYAAKKVNKGTPYFLFQHGNTYFTEDFFIKRVEYETAKKFFTFGYSKNIITKNFCNHPTLGRNIKSKENGKLHLIAPFLQGRITPFEQSVEVFNSLKNIYKFEQKIDQNLKDKILLRSSKEFLQTSRGKWYAEKYFKNFKKNQIDYGLNNYTDNLKNSRINIYFYDGTGILDNLIYNIPTIGIWNNLYNHIDDEFIEKYKFLEEANIIFDDLDNMLIHLKNVWEDPESWWLSKRTQDNIKKFNFQFNTKGNISSLYKLKNYVNDNLQ